MRKLSYGLAINEALHQKMDQDTSVFVLGQGVNNPWYVGNSAVELEKHFGRERVIDPPVSEQGMNGVGIGAALAGMRPVLIHPRMDFLLMGVEQIVNQAANWSYMFGGQVKVPLTIRAIINRGGEQAAQHSQALHSIFMHVPGIKVVVPSTPSDAKGLLVASIEDNDPVLYIDDRWLYEEEGEVEEELYSIPIGVGQILRPGNDITIVSSSYMTHLAGNSIKQLEIQGIDPELIDLRSLTPLDDELIIKSVSKTGRLVILDSGWSTGGVASEISSRISDKLFGKLLAPIGRVTLPDHPAPASIVLENEYYPSVKDIVNVVSSVMGVSK